MVVDHEDVVGSALAIVAVVHLVTTPHVALILVRRVVGPMQAGLVPVMRIVPGIAGAPEFALTRAIWRNTLARNDAIFINDGTGNAREVTTRGRIVPTERTPDPIGVGPDREGNCRIRSNPFTDRSACVP